MSKTMCEKGLKGKQSVEDPKFECKKCGARVKKDKQVCKPKEIKSSVISDEYYSW